MNVNMLVANTMSQTCSYKITMGCSRRVNSDFQQVRRLVFVSREFTETFHQSSRKCTTPNVISISLLLCHAYVVV